MIGAGEHRSADQAEEVGLTHGSLSTSLQCLHVFTACSVFIHPPIMARRAFLPSPPKLHVHVFL